MPEPKSLRLKFAAALFALASLMASSTALAGEEDAVTTKLHPALAGIDWTSAPEVVVDLKDHSYDPDEIVLTRGKPYKLILKNVGRVAHDMVGGSLFEESVIALRMVNSDAGRVIADYVNSVYVRSHNRIELWLVPLREGEYSFYCSLPGHREDGMEGFIRIVGP